MDEHQQPLDWRMMENVQCREVVVEVDKIIIDRQGLLEVRATCRLIVANTKLSKP
jgi:hypothetical protein